MRRRFAGRVASAVLLLLAAGLAGAEAEPEEKVDPQPVENEPARPAAGDGEAPPAEVFLPTEEISEDYAAPFPVDI